MGKSIEHHLHTGITVGIGWAFLESQYTERQMCTQKSCVANVVVSLPFLKAVRN